jgi:hypothetical protein
LKKDFPRDLILNKEMIRPIFSKSMSIFGEMMGRKKTFGGLRSMQDIIETNIMVGGTK